MWLGNGHGDELWLGRSRPGAKKGETRPSPVRDPFTSAPIRPEAPLRRFWLQTELPPRGKSVRCWSWGEKADGIFQEIWPIVDLWGQSAFRSMTFDLKSPQDQVVTKGEQYRPKSMLLDKLNTIWNMSIALSFLNKNFWGKRTWPYTIMRLHDLDYRTLSQTAPEPSRFARYMKIMTFCNDEAPIMTRKKTCINDI